MTKKPKQPFSAQEKKAYREPMADRAVRRYPHDLFKSAAKSHDYLADLQQRLLSLSAPIRPANEASLPLLRSQRDERRKRCQLC